MKSNDGGAHERKLTFGIVGHDVGLIDDEKSAMSR